ncbi:GH92 family glycosyl hydrolase [Flavobacterium enshiense]|uniref:GH92 family glycosyl hydrolase n=1 Tax=Flavobacterium enshiense TaxID=1341165 RepID=UPI00345CBCB6
MKKTAFLFIAALVTATGFSQNHNFAQYVNPFVGTGGHGHTFPGATVPFGMVQLSPDTRIDGSWDGCGGYHYSDSIIYGFSHTHLNGVGVSDYGDIMLMPTMGEPSFDNKTYSSIFSHQHEKASAGYYSVKLDKHNIDVRLTASTRVGFHEYTFNEAGQANVILDLNHRDKLLQGDVRIVNSRTIEILRRSEAWARDQYVFARIEFNQPMTINKVKANGKNEANFYSGTEVALSFSKPVAKGEKIWVKVALSPTGYEGAALNLTEIKHWDFERTIKDAAVLWNLELSKIQVESNDQDKLAIFYTALYHTMMQPNIAEDLDGKYRGRDNQIHVADTFDYYTVFSLWDTFRGAHPLYTLIDKKRTADYINTFIKQYEQGGRLPVWELASNETDCMIGYHSVSVIADAMVKGIKGFDYEKAFEAAKHSAMLDHLGLEAYKKNGFISIDDEHESVSKTLEYAYDDWCIAQMAKLLNKKDDFEYFMRRSQSWRNVFDSQTGFMRPKKNGGWDSPFEPREVNNNFTEGNSWQYSFFVPQDIPGLIAVHGGKEKFEAKLDELFSAPSETTGRDQADITGLIGQYAHGNEPSHHMVYLYNYVGKPEKTKKKVTYILNEFYKNTPDGLIGNEDCGQMSAWYVLNSLGIYSVTPGQIGWNAGQPYFNEARLRLENQGEIILSKETSALELENLGFKKPENASIGDLFTTLIPVPAIQAESKAFKKELEVSLIAAPGTKAFYSFEQDKKFKKYTKPFTIKKSSTVYAYSADEMGKRSNVVAASYFKKANDWSINIASRYSTQYHAGGPEGLIDGILGNENWRKGDWQGYQGQDFVAVIDLKKETKINEISGRFLQDTRAWIVMPAKVEYYISTDNVNFELAGSVSNTVAADDYKEQIKAFTLEIKAIQARYVKVKAYNFGKLPDWHQGAGGDAYIFTDEILIK